MAANLGVENLRADDKKYKFPPSNGKRRKYLLGRGIETEDPEDAINTFLQREYPEIKKCAKIPHGPVFVPDTFFYKSVKKNQYAVMPEGRDGDQATALKKHKISIAGCPTEEELFNKIRSGCMEGRENLTVFSGWKNESILRKGEDGEFDFLILSANAKTIIQIECKTEYQPKVLSKAVNQLQKGKKFFQDYFFFPEGWRYVKAAYFHSRKNAPESEFILDHESNLNQFFNDHLQPSQTPDTTTYLEMVKLLMFVLFHYSKSIVTSRDSALKATKDIEEFGSAENIIFWTKDQLELQNPACTKVAFYSTYGTGKTQLLKWKIQKVLKEYPERKVVFIMCENEDDPSRSLLADQIKIEF